MVRNTRLRNTVIRSLVASVMTFAAAPSVMAGGGMSGGATEVTQILNNTQLALQSVRQEMQYALQLQQYMVELKQLLPGELVAFGEFMLDAQQTIEAAQRVYTAGAQLFGSLEDLSTVSENRFKQFATSGLTWEDYLEREAQIAERSMNRTGILHAHEAHVAQVVQRNYENFASVAHEIPRTQGQHEALQLMNGQMAMLNGTMNEILSFQLAQSQRTTDAAVDEAGQRELQRRIDQEVEAQIAAGERANRTIRQNLIAR